MNRLYAPDLALALGAEVVLDGARRHYLGHVLRARPGTRVALFRGDGREFVAEVVSVSRRDVRLAVCEEIDGLPPSPVRVTVLQPLLKGGRLETVVQKVTELGVAAISLVETARADVRWGEKAGKRRERLLAVATEAAEQCGRADVPVIAGPRPLAAAVAAVPADAARIVFWEEARSVPLHNVLKPTSSAALLFGPEGGLDADEVRTAQEAGFVRAGLGPRVLRAETAPVAALAILQYVCGDVR